MFIVTIFVAPGLDLPFVRWTRSSFPHHARLCPTCRTAWCYPKSFSRCASHAERRVFGGDICEVIHSVSTALLNYWRLSSSCIASFLLLDVISTKPVALGKTAVKCSTGLKCTNKSFLWVFHLEDYVLIESNRVPRVLYRVFWMGVFPSGLLWIVPEQNRYGQITRSFQYREYPKRREAQLGPEAN